MQIVVTCCCVLLFLGLSACSKTLDLDAPCPDYGRYCRQIPINEEPIQ